MTSSTSSTATESASATTTTTFGGAEPGRDRGPASSSADIPSAELEQTDGGAPVALFPVRLETRFFDDGTSLAIRIFPEQIHVDSHEPDLTEAELAAGTAYWQARWAGAGAAEQASTAAWLDLAAATDVPRARWIVEVLTPGNLAQIGDDGTAPAFPDLTPRLDPWSRAPKARLLPRRWVAIGYRAGQEAFRAWGEPVRDDLLVGLSPDADGDPDHDIPLSAPLAELLGEDDLRWLVDYDSALAAGMAITVTDADLSAGTLADGLDQLVVVGIDVDRNPAEGAAEIAAQLDRHAVSDGLALLGAGTPTSNAEAASAGRGTDPRLDPAAYDPATPSAHPSGVELERALGVTPGGLSGAPGSYGLDNAVDHDLWRVVWPLTFGLMGHLFYSDAMNPYGWVDQALFEQAGRHAVDHLHPSGPFPTIRIGEQIHGVLPVLPTGTIEGTSFPALLSRFLEDLRNRLWTTIEADPVPELGDGDDPEGDLVNLLRRTAHSQLLRFRPVVTTTAQQLETDPDPDPAAYDAYLFVDPWAVFGHTDPSLTPFLATLTQSAPVPLALLTSDPLSETDPLGPDSHLANVGNNLLGAGLDPTEPKTAFDVFVSLWVISAVFLYYFPDPGAEINPELEAFMQEAGPLLLRLNEVPTAELQRRVMGILDATTHRLDAWITSLATAQLDTVRDGEAGTHIGGFGYLEHLRPEPRPTSDGYVHAPSVTHASTAALLRNAHLARTGDGGGDADGGAYAISLDSERAARGLELLDGVGSGQPVGALLGYRFERALRDRKLALAQYILAFRQADPLTTGVPVGLPADGPSEAVAAREVVDGLALLQRWKDDRNGLYDEVGVAAGHRDLVDEVLTRLDDTLDASSDVLVAEAAHQMVAGNTERAAAALDALDRQTSIPDPQVLRTPRTGVHLQHRLAVLSGTAGPAPGWDGIDDLRRRVEPRLDAWIGQVLGPPTRYRLGAQAVDGNGQVLETVTANLDQLGISAIATAVAATAAGPGGQGTELEARLALHLNSLVSSPDAVQLILLTDPPPGSEPGSLGLQDLLQLSGQIIDLVSSARPATNRDLSPESGDDEAGTDSAELRSRTALTTVAVAEAVTALEAVDAATEPEDLATVLAALDQLGRVGLPTGATDLEGERTALAALAGALTDLEDGFDRDGATADELVAHETALIRLVLGETFPVAPAFLAAAGAALAASAADPALLPGDRLAPASWLTRLRLVRAPAGRLTDLLETAESFSDDGAGLDQIVVAQAPHAPGDRWIGLPWADPDTPPAASTGIVAHTTPGTAWDQAMAGLMVDQWADLVPETEESTGLSFQYDAPEARAPQSILLAVPPDPDTPSWTVEALAATVREAMDLARIRAYDLDDLDLARRLLSANYLLSFVDLPTLFDPNADESATEPAARSDNARFENARQYAERLRSGLFATGRLDTGSGGTGRTDTAEDS